jgi:hypothetical protein
MGTADASCEYQTAIGKDEVPGPNPGSSSMKKFLKLLFKAVSGTFL